MRIETRPLSGTRFAEAWIRRDPAATSFLPADPSSLASFREKAREIDSRFGVREREVAAGLLRGGGPRAAARIAAFLAQGGYLVTTGQQPGLFGGPLYALYKGMTAAALAARLEEALDRPVLPVFWIASEHHVWEDLRSAFVIDPGNALHEVSLPPREEGSAVPVHRIPTGPELGEALRGYIALHPETEFLPRWRRLLEESYAPGVTLAEGFERVMEVLFSDAGVFLLQAHDPLLKAEALPWLLQELRATGARAEEQSELAGRLRHAGFDPQVPELEGATNLFFEGAGGRERLFQSPDGLRLRGSGLHIPEAEIVRRAEADPSLLTPNVLLRPVVESAVLPTLSYVSGPGELAYFAQTVPVFEGHGITPPILHPRAALFVVERKVGKVLEKLGLAIEDLELPEHELAGRLAREAMPAELEGSLRGLSEALSEGTRAITPPALEIDPTLRGSLDAFGAQSLGLVSELERKIVQALKRRSESTLAQLSKTRLHLFPSGRPQERVLGPMYYLSRYGDAFLEAVKAKAAESVLP